METSKKGVYAGGDIVTGPASVIGAIAQGRVAAASIDRYLGGDGKIEESLINTEIPDPYFGQTENFLDRHQPAMPCIQNTLRTAGFTEVELGYEESQAIEEAQRCLRCDMRLRITPSPEPPSKVKIK
jgi:pyruvate/2-oxoglutarate dehydrogenase complex dihydrolipoamide dehydrogenase (E3) component